VKGKSKKKVRDPKGGRTIPISALQREQIEGLARLGLNRHQIAPIVKISSATIGRRCDDELKRGQALYRQELAATLKTMGLRGDTPGVSIYLAKVHLGWWDKPPEKKAEKAEVVIVPAGVDRPAETVEQWIVRCNAKRVKS
jgi:hypothetical protein